MKTLKYQYFLQRSATILVIATFSLVLLASPTGIALTGDVTNGAWVGQLHKFAGHGLIVVAISQIVVLFLGRQFRISNPAEST